MHAESSPNRRILVAHDGELDDVCRVLEQIGGRFLERRGRPSRHACEGEWGVVIATPQALLAHPFGRESAPLRIAIVEQSSRTGLSMLRRAGVDRIVRRPVHPAALRGLLLHTVYCGPEKRRRQRVTVGAPVRFRAGLLPHGAILSELSIRGCRLLTRHAVKRDRSIVVTLPARLTGDRAVAIRGRVVRTGPASGEDVGTQAIAVVFGEMTRAVLRPLQRLVTQYARGPAILPRSAGPGSAERVRAASDPRAARTPAPDAAAPASVPPPGPGSPETGPGEPPLGSEGSGPAAEAAHREPATVAERREAQRREYERSVVALGEQAARVLIGVDLSTGGMRVAPHPDLQVGDRLRLALHVRARTEPLVLAARVDRCDGERGLVLRFEDLSDGAAEALVKFVDDLPPLAAPEPGEDTSRAAGTSGDRPVDEVPQADSGEVVVSEILERTSS